MKKFEFEIRGMECEGCAYRIENVLITIKGIDSYDLSLENQRLILFAKKDKIEDAEQLKNAINNKKILDNLRDGIPYPYTVENAQEFIIQTLNAPKDKSILLGDISR